MRIRRNVSTLLKLQFVKYFQFPVLRSSVRGSRREGSFSAEKARLSIGYPGKSHLKPRRCTRWILLFYFTSRLNSLFFSFPRTRRRYDRITQPSSGEVLLFFALHGICTVAEIAAKRWCRRRGMKPLPVAVSAPLTIGFVVATAFWLFLPPILRSDAEERIVNEAVELFSLRWTGKVVNSEISTAPS